MVGIVFIVFAAEVGVVARGVAEAVELKFCWFYHCTQLAIAVSVSETDANINSHYFPRLCKYYFLSTCDVEAPPFLNYFAERTHIFVVSIKCGA